MIKEIFGKDYFFRKEPILICEYYDEMKHFIFYFDGFVYFFFESGYYKKFEIDEVLNTIRISCITVDKYATKVSVGVGNEEVVESMLINKANEFVDKLIESLKYIKEKESE